MADKEDLKQEEDKQTEKESELKLPMENEKAAGGEYGVSHILADEKDIEAAQKLGGYHFSADELDHKEDRIDKEPGSESLPGGSSEK